MSFNFYRRLRQGVPRQIWLRLQSGAKRKLQKNVTLWAMLENYLRATRSTGCAYTDYLALHQFVRRQKPLHILECGTGVSTIVLAQALRENEQAGGKRGVLVSMEELPEYYDLAQRLLPDEVAAYVEIRLSPTVEDSSTFIRGMRYRDVPELPYDFMFIDGPDPRTRSDRTISCDFDFIYQTLRLEDEKPLYGIVDRRTTTCLALQALFGRDKVCYDYVRELGFVGPCRRSDLTESAVSYHRSAPRPFRRQWFFNKFPCL